MKFLTGLNLNCLKNSILLTFVNIFIDSQRLCIVKQKLPDTYSDQFLLVVFPFQGNMPDSYSDLFFLVTTDLTLIGRFFTETTEAKSSQRKRSAKGPPPILLKSPLGISELKRYIRTFDVISELYCVLLRRRERFENRSFS